jgi:cell division septation protein DedD
MKYLCDAGSCRSSILKYISILFFMISACLIMDMGNNACPADGAIYSIHLFSFKGREDAKAKTKEFNDLGYNAFFRQETADGKADVYNVYIERFKSRSEAEKEANILKELGLISDYDIREIIEEPEIIPKTEKQETGTAAQTVKSYYLKVGSLREKSNAEEIVKRLQDAGYHAFYNYETVKGLGDWYRVYIDEYKSKADAEKDARKLMESGVISGYEIKRTTEKILAAETKQKDEKRVYSLHVASYRSSGNADDDVMRLTGLGFKAFSIKTTVSGEQWFRVYIGEFSEETEARKTGAELTEKGVITYFKPLLIDKTRE